MDALSQPMKITEVVAHVVVVRGWTGEKHRQEFLAATIPDYAERAEQHATYCREHAEPGDKIEIQYIVRAQIDGLPEMVKP